MKNLRIALVASVCTFYVILVVYMFGAFVAASWNITQWDASLRFIVGMLASFAAIMTPLAIKETYV